MDEVKFFSQDEIEKAVADGEKFGESSVEAARTLVFL